MKKIASIILAVGFAGYLLFVVFSEVTSNADGICRELIVVIKDSADRKYLNRRNVVAQLKNTGIYPVNKPLNQVNTETIKRKLLESRVVAKAIVYKTPSGAVKIEITQKVPILRVFNSEGSYYIDESGSIMPADYRYATRLPIASGNIDRKLATGDLYQFARLLKENDFWNEQIEQIHVLSENEIELTPRVGNHRIVMGNLKNCEEKLEKLRLFYQQAIPKVGWDKYEIINLKYKNQIVCVKREHV